MWLLLISGILKTVGAEILYTFDQPGLHFTVDQTPERLEVRSNGLTRILPLNGCTLPAAKEFIAELDQQRLRLIDFAGSGVPPQGRLVHRGRNYLLLELGVRNTAPDYFARTPARFLNLLTQERHRCSKFF